MEGVGLWAQNPELVRLRTVAVDTTGCTAFGPALAPDWTVFKSLGLKVVIGGRCGCGATAPAVDAAGQGPDLGTGGCSCSNDSIVFALAPLAADSDLTAGRAWDFALLLNASSQGRQWPPSASVAAPGSAVWWAVLAGGGDFFLPRVEGPFPFHLFAFRSLLVRRFGLLSLALCLLSPSLPLSLPT